MTNGRYYEKGTDEPLFNLIDSNVEFKEEKQIIPKIDLNDAFDINEIPF